MTKYASRPARRGYILVMTLFLLAMAGSALLGLAAESHRRARQALLAQEQLQKRWGAYSTERTLLPRNAEFLKAVAMRHGRPVAQTQVSFELNRQRFVAIISDEQAKVNPNAFGVHVDSSSVEKIITQLVPDPIAIRLHPAKRPVTAKDGSQTMIDHYTTFGQLFAEIPPAMLMGNGITPGFTDNLTCWGDGKLNLSTASASSLIATCSLDLSHDQLTRLKDDLRQHPDKTAADIVELQRFSPAQRATLDKRFTKESKCHSLWIAADVTGRPTYRFVVRADGKPAETNHFTW